MISLISSSCFYFLGICNSNRVFRILSRSVMFIKLCTNSVSNLTISVAYDLPSTYTYTGIVYAALILICLYIMIIFEVIIQTNYNELHAKDTYVNFYHNANVYVLIGFLSALLHLTYQIVHRTLAAMLASTMSIAILATLNEVDILSRNFHYV